MSTTSYLYPTQVTRLAGSGGWTFSTGTDAITLLADSSDSTWIKKSSAVAGQSFMHLACVNQTIADDEKIVRVRARVRMSRPNANSKTNIGLVRETSTGPIITAMQVDTGAFSTGDVYGPWFYTAPGGNEWTQDMLSATGVVIGDTISSTSQSAYYSTFYKVDLEVEVNTAPYVTFPIGPTGTITSTLYPTVDWTGCYVDDDGDTQNRFQVKVFSDTQTSAPGFDPDTTTPVYDSGIIVSAATTHVPTSPLPPTGAFAAYVRVAHLLDGPYAPFWQVFNGGWTPNFAYFTMAVDGPPTAEADAVWDQASQAAELTIQGRVNVLTADEASDESALGLTADSNCSVARVTPLVAADGTKATEMTASSAGTMVARSGYHDCEPDMKVSALASLKAGTTGRTCRVGVRFETSGGSLVANSWGPTFSDSTSSYTVGKVENVTVPATAVRYRILLEVQSAANGEKHVADKRALHPGAAAVWSPGGHSDIAATVTVTPDGAGDLRAERVTLDPTTQQGTYTDHLVQRGRNDVAYEVVTTSVFGGVAFGGDAAVTDPIVTTSDGLWWFKLPDNTDASYGTNLVGDAPTRRVETAGLFRGIGRSTVEKVSGDLYGPDGSYAITTRSPADWTAFEEIYLEQGPVLVQDPYGRQKWVAWEPDGRSETPDLEPARERHTINLTYQVVGAP